MPSYTFCNRNYYPPRKSGNGDWHLETTPSSPIVPLSFPAFFAVDSGVEDAKAEYLTRAKQRLTHLDASFILQFEKALVFPGSFIVADRSNRIQSASMRTSGALHKSGFVEDKARTYSHSQIPNPELMLGSYALLGIQTNHNYFHWVFEAAPRIHLLKAEGFLSPDVRIVSPPLRPWMEDVLRGLGVGKEQIFELTGDAPVRFEHLLVAARGLFNIRTFTHHAVSMVESLRCEQRGERKLFVSRAKCGSRRISNEEEILSKAASLGYEAVFPETMPFEEQRRTFASATHVAGALGAGLMNIAFCAPGAALIEFAPEKRSGDATLFRNMVHHFSSGYAGVVGHFSGAFDRPDDRKDFTVNVDLAIAALESVER